MPPPFVFPIDHPAIDFQPPLSNASGDFQLRVNLSVLFRESRYSDLKPIAGVVGAI